MSEDDLLKHNANAVKEADVSAEKPKDKEEDKGHPGRLMVIAGLVAAGAFILIRKFKGKLPPGAAAELAK